MSTRRLWLLFAYRMFVILLSCATLATFEGLLGGPR